MRDIFNNALLLKLMISIWIKHRPVVIIQDRSWWLNMRINYKSNHIHYLIIQILITTLPTQLVRTQGYCWRWVDTRHLCWSERHRLPRDEVMESVNSPAAKWTRLRKAHRSLCSDLAHGSGGGEERMHVCSQGLCYPLDGLWIAKHCLSHCGVLPLKTEKNKNT